MKASEDSKSLWWKDGISLDQYDLTVIGFSKGCVVLNQFLYEYHYLKTLTPDVSSSIVSKIKDMYWLDGGHSGGKNTWITSRALLETLARLGGANLAFLANKPIFCCRYQRTRARDSISDTR